MKRVLYLVVLVSAVLLYLPLHAQPVDGLRVAWDRSSEVKIARHGNYARVIMLDDASFLAAFEYAGGVSVATSADLKTWSTPRPVIPGFSGRSEGLDFHVHVANPELCLTREGTLLLAVNYRPSGRGLYPFSIVLLRSDDRGLTWSAPDVLYRAGCDFADGCWEPSFLLLPDGSIHLYFANEGPYTDSDEQEISLLVSEDDGRTWSGPGTVSFRAGHRDGMPVAALSGDTVVLAIEDNADGKFKPYIVRTSVESPWPEPVGGNSSLRTKALADHVSGDVYMGAPYLVTLPTGEALLSYQTTEDRGEAWELSCMEVAVSDDSVAGFSKRTRPFDVPSHRSGKWNSLLVVDGTTVIAVSSTDKDGVTAPYMVKGHIIGVPDGKDSRNTLFVGARTHDNLTCDVRHEGGCFIFSAEVNDRDITGDDGVTFLLDITGGDNLSPRRGIFKICVGYDGKDLRVYEGCNGVWRRRFPSFTEVKASRTDCGYVMNLAFSPKTARRGGYVRTAVVHSNSFSDGSSYAEPLVLSDPDIPATWHKMSIL